MHGFASVILATIADALPPIVRLAVMPMWKVELLADGGHLTVGEVRVLARTAKLAGEIA